MRRKTTKRMDKLENLAQAVNARFQGMVDITDIFEMISSVYGTTYTGPRVWVTREQKEQMDEESSRMAEVYRDYFSRKNPQPSDPTGQNPHKEQ